MTSRMPRRYTEEETREILTRALAKQETRADFTREDLEQMARELGVSHEQLAAAEAELLAPPSTDAELARLREEFLAERRRKVLGNLAATTVVLVVLAVLSVLDLPFSGFAGFILIFAFFSSLHKLREGANVFFGGEMEDEEHLEEAFDAWLERRHARRARLGGGETPRLPER